MTDKPALKLKRLQDMAVKGKRVLVRVDYNVPMKGSKIEDNARIRETLKTLAHLISEGAKIVLISHLGRPKGKIEPKYSLKPVAAGSPNSSRSPSRSLTIASVPSLKRPLPH